MTFSTCAGINASRCCGSLLPQLLLLLLLLRRVTFASGTGGDPSAYRQIVQQRGWPPCRRAASVPLSPLAFAAARISGWDMKPLIVCLIDELTTAARLTSSSTGTSKLQKRRRNHLRRLRLALADSLQELGEVGLAEEAYREAAAAAASADTRSPNLEDWHQLGWFPIGTGELDEDPVLAAFGSLPNAVARLMLEPAAEAADVKTPKSALITELSDGSKTVRWQPIDEDGESNGVIRLAPDVAWAELVNTLGSTAALEFQGWLIAGVYTALDAQVGDNRETGWSLVCDGPAAVTVDDVIDLAADRYMRGRAISPVAGRLLTGRRGVHLLAAKIRGKQAAAVSCRFVSSSSSTSASVGRLDFRVWPPDFLPDLWLPDGDKGPVRFLTGESAPIAFPLVSLRSSGGLQCRLKMGGNKDSSGLTITKFSSYLFSTTELAPGQLGFAVGELHLPSDDRRRSICTPGDGVGVRLTLRLTCGDSGSAQAIQISLRCRSSTQSVLFTFVDHDGSVQRAAVIAPLEWQQRVVSGGQKSPHRLSASVPIVVSLHGTSIKPEDQADSHKFMEAGADASAGYRFGIAGAWLLAPSRHGAHNWEGPGALTVNRSVEVLSVSTTKSAPGGVSLPAADPNRLVFLGHSMGGHGALVMATHWPGRSIGVASLSGWLRKEDYGDNNVFFRHDLSSWQVSPRLKSILEAANAENYVDSHLENIKSLPIFLRVGSADRVVPPYFLRRLARQLASLNASRVQFDEVAGQGHWWWDTRRPNDGGVMNDEQVQQFLTSAISQSSRSCKSQSSQCSTTIHSAEKYYSGVARESFTLATYNPAFMGSLNGFRIDRQLLPSLLSTIKVALDPHSHNRIQIKTQNVLQFSVEIKPSIDENRLLNDYDLLESIDGQLVEVDFVAKSSNFHSASLLKCRQVQRIDAHRSTSSEDLSSWKCWHSDNVGSWETNHKRSESQLGPMRRVAEQPFAFIYDPDICTESLAVFLSNQFHLTSDTPSAVLPLSRLSELSADIRNFIYLGSWNSSAGQSLTGRINLPANCVLLPLVAMETGASFVGLVPASGFAADIDSNRNDEAGALALAFLATDFAGLRSAAISLASPTIPPMARSPFTNWLPDYLVLKAGTGPGAFHCAGYYDNDWGYHSALASCVCVL